MSPATSTASTCSARTVSTRGSRKADCAARRSARCSDRPRCQSEVCSNRMARTLAEGTDITQAPLIPAAALAVGVMRGCVPLLGMSPPRRYLPPAVLAITLIVAPLSACSSSPKPQPTASAYLADWGRQDWTAMRALTDGPPADFTSVNQAAFSTLSVRQASITAGTMATNGTAASEPITERLTLTGLGAITFSSTLHLG